MVKEEIEIPIGELFTATEILFDIAFEERFQKFAILNHLESELK